jgi:VWFA-related protein
MRHAVSRRMAAGIFFVALSSLGQQASSPDTQKPAAPPEVTFAARTELVTIPVVVTDKKGQHITGLKQSDFTIEEKGHVRPIATFEEISGAKGPFKPATPSEFPFSNFALTRQETRRVTIVVLDLLNTPFFNQTNAREQLVKYLNAHLQDQDPTSLTLLTSHGLRLVHSFTTDPAILVDAMKRVESRYSAPDQTAAGQLSELNSSGAFDSAISANLSPSVTAAAEASQMQQILAQRADASYRNFVQRDQTVITLYALQELAQSAAGIPGRKSVIWASGGLPFLVNDPNSLTGIDTTLMSNYEQTLRAMNDANVAVYPIDAHGLVAPDIAMQSMTSKNGLGGPLPAMNSRRSQFAIDPMKNLQDSLKAFADATGGKACYDRNDLDHCFALAAEDASQYYMLTYYLPADDRKPGWRKLKVRVGPPHGEIRAREQVYVGENKVPTPQNVEQQFELAFSSPLDYTAVAMGWKFTGSSPGENGERKVAFQVFVQPNSFTVDDNWVKLNVHVVATDAKNKAILVYSKQFHAHLKADNAAQVVKSGFIYNGEMLLSPGRYQLKLLVRDDFNGKFGSVQAPYSVN